MEKPTTAREVLDLIDNFLLEGDSTETNKLWDVLSALRGPDSDDFRLKDETTIHIRRAAFPRFSSTQNRWGDNKTRAVFTSDHPYVSPRTTSSASGHFCSHIRSAAMVLGLK